MFVSDLASICIHAPGCLAGLDVAPDHRCHVTLVIHESSIEVRGFVRVGRHDVGAAARERIFQEVEHGEEFALRHEDMVTKEAELCQYH